MTTTEIQHTILSETGIKTSVKKGTGSMKGYTIFSPMFQNGEYPKFPFEWRREFKTKFPLNDDKPMFVDDHSICIFYGIEQQEPTKYKRESKPKSIAEMKVREWGSENSQFRLDQKASRYAKRRRGPNGDNTVKYW